MTAPTIERHPGLTGQAIDTTGRLLGSLPPSFLVLALLNILFLGGVLWFLNSQTVQRTAILSRVLDACVEQEAETAHVPR